MRVKIEKVPFIELAELVSEPLPVGICLVVGECKLKLMCFPQTFPSIRKTVLSLFVLESKYIVNTNRTVLNVMASDKHTVESR